MTTSKLDQPGSEQPENTSLPEHVKRQKPLREPPPERRQARGPIAWVVALSVLVLVGLLLVLAFYQPDSTERNYSWFSTARDAPQSAGVDCATAPRRANTLPRESQLRLCSLPDASPFA